jgi:hypothetical protein
MNSPPTGKLRSSLDIEIRYERSFLLDLEHLDAPSRRQVQQFVLDDFVNLTHLQDLPEFRQLGSSQIYYRFSLDRYLIGLEITGKIIKFIRVIPKPDV